TRSKRLLRYPLAVVRHVRDDSRLVEKPLVAAPLATGDDIAAAILRVGDKTIHGVEPARIRHRPHADAFLKAVAELESVRVISKAREKFLVHAFLHVEAR